MKEKALQEQNLSHHASEDVPTAAEQNSAKESGEFLAKIATSFEQRLVEYTYNSFKYSS